MTPEEPAECVLGVDSGGSGLRAALHVRQGLRRPEPVRSAKPVRTGPRGIDAGHFTEQLLPMARGLLEQAGGGRIAAVAVGAAGMATLGDDLRAALPAALGRTLGVRSTALAADAVTAYAGALGDRPGAVVAAGTGMIAIGTDLTAWRRADGWGHLLGDCGGGAWIGRAGLEAAMRAHDGRRGGSRALLARAEAVFGPPAGLPGQLYPRADRPAVLASFAPDVAECAADDPVADGILRAAARHIAESAAAVCPAADACEVAFTGGLFHLGEPLLAPLRAELADQLPHARPVPAAGDPLDGALRIAADIAGGRLRLPLDPRMLSVHDTGDHEVHDTDDHEQGDS
ncbi:N-acetylglucosamine kinase [Streptomyces sp. Je 1-369]|uniref:N-acetylglucosamine kinase n=1 Tax=Streptomyces sp. Je 1-369 TaxID=2966192 RepID=UPI002286A857|nr:BadF/BadG/BcrA/BcrD ATPase family protein [Streptomyces sp. Je 1-369]WAL94083.1 ATPase [Streptomyces sp. Je 1-369]